MAVSYDECYDPEEEAREISEQADSLERAIDGILREAFREGVRRRRRIAPGWSVTNDVAHEVLRRYRRVGWRVRWDGDCSSTACFFFKPPRKGLPWWMRALKLLAGTERTHSTGPERKQLTKGQC